ncbi:MAG: hypothetical protein ACYTEY_18490 [Planctomycetota bacterium]|jgi:hypothetical protein
MAAIRLIHRSVLPAASFIVVLGFHFAWIGLFPEDNPAQNRWVSIGPAAQPSWLARYIDGQHYWMGYVYALSLGFAVIAVRRYLEDRSCRARNFAIGGVTFSGFMSVAGCFLVGCCGSPMLGVYLSLFGAAFLPFAKPLAAAICTLLILGSYLWLRRMSQRARDRQLEACACTVTGPKPDSCDEAPAAP